MRSITAGAHPIALSFDLEYWWCSELLNQEKLSHKPEILTEATHLVLQMLDKYRIKSTFFILGTVAEKFPQLVSTIHKKGHEVASHSHSHSNVFELAPDQFEEEVKNSTDILTSITYEKPIGFRAPNFSFDQRTPWAYGILEKYGYQYSSSVFPFKTKLYGLPKAPVYPYSPSRENLEVPDPEGKFIEFPAPFYSFRPGPYRPQEACRVLSAYERPLRPASKVQQPFPQGQALPLLGIENISPQVRSPPPAF